MSRGVSCAMLDLSQVLAFSLTAGLLVMFPGPNGVLVTKTVSSSGRSADLANVAAL